MCWDILLRSLIAVTPLGAELHKVASQVGKIQSAAGVPIWTRLLPRSCPSCPGWSKQHALR